MASTNQDANPGDGTGRVDKVPAHSIPKWPKGLQINRLRVFLEHNLADAMTIDGVRLKPYIPLDQLARFLNDHVEGAVEKLMFKGGDGAQDLVPRLLDEVTVPGLLHTDMLFFIDFFDLPWASIERTLDGRTLHTDTIAFCHMQLPCGVDANELLKLPTVCDCRCLFFQPHRESLTVMPGRPPAFKNAALTEWIEQGDRRILVLASDCLSSGYLSFLNALRKGERSKGFYPMLYSPLLLSRVCLVVKREQRESRVAAGPKLSKPSFKSLPSITYASRYIQVAIVISLLLQNFQEASQVHSYCVEILCPSINGVTGGLGVQDDELFNQLGERMTIEVGEDLDATEKMGYPFEAVRVTRVHKG